MSARAREALGLPPLPEHEPAPAAPPPPTRSRRVVALVAAGALVAIAWLLTRGYSGPPIAYDFGGDGAQDIAIAAPGLDALLLHEGGGVVSIPKATTGGPADGLTSADFDGDGYVDLAVGVAARDEVMVFFGTADGISHERRRNLRAEDFELPADSRGYGSELVAANFDDDGYADVVVGAPGHGDDAGAVAVIRGGPEGFATTGHQLLSSDESAPGRRLGSERDEGLRRLTRPGPHARSLSRQFGGPGSLPFA